MENTKKKTDRILFSVENLGKHFTLPQGRVMVLENLNFEIRQGEFIAIVGPSGAGKSTLLRMLNGLLSPSQGQIHYKGKAQTRANIETAMVFQNFALLPWLTVFQNVELGIAARTKDKALAKKRASFYIDKVGLDGYEEAYPRELSGGMKQRVGLARALAVEPEVLLMDEPFSSLDALTSINLRDELIDIWNEPDTPVHTLVMVTHMIEEALEMADRILVLSARPGHLVGDLAVGMPRPRNKRDPQFLDYFDKVFSLLA